jgi:hypothetical protein
VRDFVARLEADAHSQQAIGDEPQSSRASASRSPFTPTAAPYATSPAGAETHTSISSDAAGSLPPRWTPWFLLTVAPANRRSDRPRRRSYAGGATMPLLGCRRDKAIPSDIDHPWQTSDDDDWRNVPDRAIAASGGGSRLCRWGR